MRKRYRRYRFPREARWKWPARYSVRLREWERERERLIGRIEDLEDEVALYEQEAGPQEPGIPHEEVMRKHGLRED